MKHVNLFPYRRLHQAGQIRQFQRHMAISLVSSAALAGVWIGVAPFGALAVFHSPEREAVVSQYRPALSPTMQAEMASMESVLLEREQRQQMLLLLHDWASQPAMGIDIRAIQWSQGAFILDASVSSHDMGQVWVQRLQSFAGVHRVEVDAIQPNLASATATERRDWKVRLQIGTSRD
jgi:hypothetical protein